MRNNPRRHRDDADSQLRTVNGRGQPPRTRRRPAFLREQRDVHRATPASAGTTRRRPGARGACGSNPRGCGDDDEVYLRAGAQLEQPLRAWGRHEQLIDDPAVHGTTPVDVRTTRPGARGPAVNAPTDARMTLTTRSITCPTSDNPRGREDDAVERLGTGRLLGQPRRARGRPLRGAFVHDGHRATPASAGTTVRRGLCPVHRASNLRGRGDDALGTLTLIRKGEQPPQARGRHDQRPGTARSRRTTSAGAGTTGHVRERVRPVRGQPPRARGRRLRLRSGRGRGRTTLAGGGAGAVDG